MTATDPDFHGVPASARRDHIFTGARMRASETRFILGADNLDQLVAILQDANASAMRGTRGVDVVRCRAIRQIVDRLGIEREFLDN